MSVDVMIFSQLGKYREEDNGEEGIDHPRDLAGIKVVRWEDQRDVTSAPHLQGRNSLHLQDRHGQCVPVCKVSSHIS
jgi:hypothetical protein